MLPDPIQRAIAALSKHHFSMCVQRGTDSLCSCFDDIHSLRIMSDRYQRIIELHTPNSHNECPSCNHTAMPCATAEILLD